MKNTLKTLVAAVLLFTLTYYAFYNDRQYALSQHTMEQDETDDQPVRPAGAAAQPEQPGQTSKPASPGSGTRFGLSPSLQFVHYADKVAVLIYHHIDQQESALTISPDLFRDHLKALKEHDFNVISVESLIGFLQSKQPVPPNAVVITFDDGYESFYRYAYPELKARQMPATNFLIVSYVDDRLMHKPAMLHWNEILEMKKDGMSFYSHTYNSHASVADIDGNEKPPLTTHLFLKDKNRRETDEEYKSRVEKDLQKAKLVLKEKLGNAHPSLCFPYGKYTPELLDVASEAGVEFFFGGEEGLNTGGERVIKRINTGVPYMTTDLLITKLTGNK